MKFLYLTLFFVFCLATSALAVVNINTGGMDELTSLPGIGPVKAEAIIKYREEKGQFQTIKELKNVYGIGEKTVARIQDDITVGEDASTVAETVVKGEGKEPAPKAQEKEVVSKTSPGKKAQ